MSTPRIEFEGKVLMEEGSWKIISAREYFIQKYNLNSYIVHKCPEHDTSYYDPHMQYWWHEHTFDLACYICDQSPPAHIKTLWQLHNFDYIQGGYGS